MLSSEPTSSRTRPVRLDRVAAMGAMGSTPSRCCEGCGDREAAEAEEVVAKPWTEEPGWEKMGSMNTNEQFP